MSKENRLKLNWDIHLRKERIAFIEEYLPTISNPTQDELTTMANYVLWGKESYDEKDGPARIKHEGLIIESKSKDWTDDRANSLEGLLETPGFSENEFSHPTTRKTREVFSRSEARSLASPLVLSALEDLWRHIDSTDLVINFYDLAHEKRKTPIRQELLDRFTPEEQETFRNRAFKLNQRTYLKLKHELVELRKQQYVYKDSYKQTLFSKPSNNSIFYKPEEPIEFDADIPILPISLKYNAPLYKKLFNPERFPAPDDFNEKELEEISNLLWTPAPSTYEAFDFTNPDHLYKLYSNWVSFEEEIENNELDDNSTLVQFINTAKAYEGLAQLEPLHKDLLIWKIQKKSNLEIQSLVKEKYNHKYQENYISTLYCKTLKTIAETAAFHREVCENLAFPEEFKKCKDCGRSLLLTNRDWVKSARSKDGFSPRCKFCEKIKRNSKGGK